MPSLWKTLLLGGFPISAAAQECRGWEAIKEPADLDKFANCEAWDGTLDIDYRFPGPLVLPNLVNITGTIKIEYHGHPPQGQHITSLEAPDLVSLGEDLLIDNMQPITRVSFPQLETIRSLTLTESGTDLTIDFPSLEEAGSISIFDYSSFASVNFDSLRTVSDDLTIQSCGQCNYPSTTPPSSFGISFPFLESAGFIQLAGAISSVTMPRLFSAGPPAHSEGTTSTNSGLRLDLNVLHDGYDLDFANLTSIDKQLYIQGDIESLQIPALQDTDASIHIDSGRPLSLNSPLISASNIELIGSIESASFPNLSEFSQITVNSQSNFNCGGFEDAITETSSYPDDNSTLVCDSPSGGGLALPAKIAIGVVVPVVAIVAALIIWQVRRARNNKRNRATDRNTHDNSSVSTPAPTYAEPERQTARTSRARTPSPPPPYSPQEGKGA